MPVRRITREAALAAVTEAADALGVAPDELTVARYRQYRATREAPTALPSHMAIAVVLGGWTRACQLAAESTPAPRGRPARATPAL